MSEQFTWSLRICHITTAGSAGYFPTKSFVIRRSGQSQGTIYKHRSHVFIPSFIKGLPNPFPATALWRCHAQTVIDSFYGHKIDYVTNVMEWSDLSDTELYEGCDEDGNRI